LIRAFIEVKGTNRAPEPHACSDFGASERRVCNNKVSNGLQAGVCGAGLQVRRNKKSIFSKETLEMKRTLTIVLSLALVVILAAVPALAASSSTSASGYGTLTGTVSASGSYTTSVTNNPDNAKLTITGLIQNASGSNLTTQQLLKSQRGVTYIAASWSSLPSGTYAIYGTHGVQEGSTNPAAAVYTVTHV
jgi:hypothetical protein